MKDTEWFENTIGELADSPDLRPNDVKAMLVDGMLRFLHKTVTMGMLLDIVRAVQTYRQYDLSPDVEEIITRLIWLLSYPDQLDPENRQIQHLAEKVLRTIKV
jgi:hypothetical protein